MIRKELQGQQVTITADGWKSSTNVPIIGIATGKTLLALIEERGARHTADWLSDLLAQEIPRLQNLFGLKCVAVCTDNASPIIDHLSFTKHNCSESSLNRMDQKLPDGR